MGAKPTMVVMANTLPGSDEESFNAWYTGEHISQVLALDGFESAKRYQISRGREGQHQYLTVFEIEEGRLEDARAAMSAATKAGVFTGHPALAMDFVRMWFEPIASRERNDGR